MKHERGKEPTPQTVEALQQIMARDAETMLEMRREIGDLRSKLNRSNHKNQTLWKRIANLEREQATSIKMAEVPHGV
jgi:cell division protein FtsL